MKRINSLRNVKRRKKNTKKIVFKSEIGMELREATEHHLINQERTPIFEMYGKILHKIGY